MPIFSEYSQQIQQHKIQKLKRNNEFKVEVVVNNTLATVMADTGARVSVWQAKKWNLTKKNVSFKYKIKIFLTPTLSKSKVKQSVL